MEAIGAEIAGELLFATAAEAIMADTMAIAAMEVGAAAIGATEAGMMIGADALIAGLTGEATMLGAAGAFDAAGMATGVDAGTLMSDAGLFSAAQTYGTGPATTQLAGEAAVKKPFPQQILDGSVPDTGPGTSPEVATHAERAFTEGAKAGTPKKGIINRFADWAETPTGGMVLGQSAMGALQGAGAGAGAVEAAKRKAASDSALLAQQTEERLRMSREGTYAGWAGVRPSGQKVLRRADGSLVYLPNNGLINNAMR